MRVFVYVGGFVCERDRNWSGRRERSRRFVRPLTLWLRGTKAARAGITLRGPHFANLYLELAEHAQNLHLSLQT